MAKKDIQKILKNLKEDFEQNRSKELKRLHQNIKKSKKSSAKDTFYGKLENEITNKIRSFLKIYNINAYGTQIGDYHRSL